MIPQHFIDELNRDADLLTIIGKYVKLVAKGKSYVGLCPFHNEKTPSFNVVPEKGFYHCFGCEASGNALKFLTQHVHGNDFMAAVEDLAQSLGRKLPQRESGPRMPVHLLEKISSYYHYKLLRNTSAKEYLKTRGISSKKIAKRFCLGFAPKDGGLRELFGDDPKVNNGLVQVGLARRQDKDDIWAYFRNRIMFPITTPTGKTVGFGGRVIGNMEPKYLNSPQSVVFDKGRLVYGLREANDAVRTSGTLLVVEGYMDVVMLACYGIDNAVATMGTAATQIQLKQLLQRADKVIFCFDGDAAGRAAAYKVLANVMPVIKDGKSVWFALLPEKEDPDSYVKKHGKEKFLAMLERALPLEQMLLDLPITQADGSAAEASGQMHRISELIETINRDKAPFLYEELYKQLSEKSKISSDDLKRAAQNLRSISPKPKPKPEQFTAQVAPRHAKVKREQRYVWRILVCLCAQPSLADQCKDADLRPLGRDGEIIHALLAKLSYGSQNVPALLQKLNYPRAAQVQQEAQKWQRIKIDPQNALAAVLKAIQKQAKQDMRKEATRAQMHKAKKSTE